MLFRSVFSVSFAGLVSLLVLRIIIKHVKVGSILELIWSATMSITILVYGIKTLFVTDDEMVT